MSVIPEVQLISLRLLLREAYRFQLASPEGKHSIAELMRQIELFWHQIPGTPDEKFNFIRARLTTLFLWDRSQVTQYNRNLFNPTPLALLEYFREQRVQRLHALPDGKLFHAGQDCCIFSHGAAHDDPAPWHCSSAAVTS